MLPALGNVIASGFLFGIQHLLRIAFFKFLFTFFIFVLVSALMPILLSLFPSFMTGLDIQNQLNQFGDAFHYYAKLFALDIGFNLVITSYIARFLVRRLPIIG